jgi:vacuolar-type H+-ATPase subunit E/Vma4
MANGGRSRHGDPTEEGVVGEPRLAEGPAPADPHAVGEEVAAVLKSAQEAAATIRRTAQEEAMRIRAAAEAFVEQRSKETQREVAHLLGKAEARLAGADAEVGRKLRQADQEARERLDNLEAAAARYEEWIENMVEVFRGATSNLEDLLRSRLGESGTRDRDEAQEDVLRQRAAPGNRF